MKHCKQMHQPTSAECSLCAGPARRAEPSSGLALFAPLFGAMPKSGKRKPERSSKKQNKNKTTICLKEHPAYSSSSPLKRGMTLIEAAMIGAIVAQEPSASS